MAYTPPKLTDTERQLSEFVFEHYYSNSKPGERSRVSDEFARNLRGNKDRIFRLATLLAKMVEPEYADKIGEVTGFHVTGFHVNLASSSGTISDLLQKLLNPKPLSLDAILRRPLNDPTLGVNPIVLWAKAFVVLTGLYSDADFDPEYAEVADDEFRPAIRGDNINIVSVNGALLQVLREADLAQDIDPWFFATHQDEGGWIFSRGGIDG
jgi:hypothetical protein